MTSPSPPPPPATAAAAAAAAADSCRKLRRRRLLPQTPPPPPSMEESREAETLQDAENTVKPTKSEETTSGEATGGDQNEGRSSTAWIPPFRRAGRSSSSIEIDSVTTYTRNQQRNRHFLLQRFDDRWGPTEKKDSPPPPSEHQRLAEALRMEQRFRQVSVGGDGKDALTLSGSKRPRFPSRPCLGNSGIQCVVKVNHFLAHVHTHNVLHHYDVSITPGVSSHTTNRAVMDELLKLYGEAYLGMRLPVYDGRKSLYTVSPLPFISKDFKVVISLEDEDSNSQRKEKEFKVVVKLVARSNLNELKLFLEGTRVDCPQDTLQILDVVLRAFPTTRFTRVGPSFYSPHLGKRQRLGGGLESWRGFYQSIRPTQMGLSLNIDISSSSFLEALPIPEFISQILNRDISSRSFTNAEFMKLRKSLKGVKVEVMHRGKMRRKYRISSLTTETAAELTFPDNNTKILKSIVEHFKIAYDYDIEHPEWPCLKVGNPQRPSVLPMEVCRVVDGQKYSKKLDERQINNLLKMACQPPDQREKDISNIVCYNDYHKDPYCKEFGIDIYGTLTSIEARVLPTPRLKFNDTGKERDCLPYIGQWNMKNKKMADGGTVNNWICINFSINVQETVVKEFCNEIAMMCNISGMSFNTVPILPVITSSPGQVERVLKAQYHDAIVKLQPLQQELDLIIFILPEYNGPLYGDIKRICDIDLGLVSQCCLSKHVFKMAKQYLANLSLKINAKLGGRNAVLMDALSKSLPLIGDQPTIIFGADVNHPHPGEDISPSIAAVVASQDWPEITKYAGLVSNQTHRQELIEDMFTTWEDPSKGTQFGGMIRELLTSFQKSTGQKPQRLIFYRDGVSEGQFYQVLTHEIEAIRKACASLEPDYQPPITFIVVQKRHHTRIFPNNHHDFSSVDRSGNILPGTVVDSKICHPTEFDFYLCSHAGIQGTSRPTHYHVLWDENNFTADQLQSLTYSLCYTYARCTRSVSIAPPAYYAHLAAARARWYGERETGTTVTKTGRPMVSNVTLSGIQALESGPKTRPLPTLTDSAKSFMFY